MEKSVTVKTKFSVDDLVVNTNTGSLYKIASISRVTLSSNCTDITKIEYDVYKITSGRSYALVSDNISEDILISLEDALSIFGE